MALPNTQTVKVTATKDSLFGKIFKFLRQEGDNIVALVETEAAKLEVVFHKSSVTAQTTTPAGRPPLAAHPTTPVTMAQVDDSDAALKVSSASPSVSSPVGSGSSTPETENGGEGEDEAAGNASSQTPAAGTAGGAGSASTGTAASTSAQTPPLSTQ